MRPQDRASLEAFGTLAKKDAWDGLDAPFGYPSAPVVDRRVQVGKLKDNLVQAAVATVAGADMVNLPHHYARFAIEPIRFVAENGLDFLRANAIKYIMRCDAKNGREDLKKAHRYLDMFEKWFFDKDPDWWRAEHSDKPKEAKP